jgi:pimeloyl-ACP methyl ester carboxylesterase
MERRRAQSIHRYVRASIAVGLWQGLGGIGSAQPTSPTAQQWVTRAITAPRLQQRTFQSAAVGMAVSYHVYTPEIYDSAPERRFPVLYWLHGSGGGGGTAPLTARLDSAIRADKVPPMLVVFPNGLANGMWVDWKDSRVPMETVVVKELLPHIDATFRTIASRDGRLIEGFSMGGYGAARLAFKYPDVFGSVSILGGGPLQEELRADNSPRATPAQTQAVLDTVYGGDQEYFKAQSPWRLAEQNVDAVRRLRIRQVVGEKDNVLENNRKLHDRLSRLNIPHTFTVAPGASHNLRQVLDALGDRHWEFYRDAFASVARPSAGGVRSQAATGAQPEPQSAPWTDPARHTVRFITVTPGVRLEVLDWGGTGPPVVLLAGGGNTGHSFDEFAPQLADALHVYAVTRRGYGASSHPGTGYDLPTLTADLVAVLDSLHLTSVALVGHSLAGDEMTRLATTHPARVTRLVYLDAAHDRSTMMADRQAAGPPPPEPPMTAADSASPASVRAYHARLGTPLPESEIRATQVFSADGRVQRFLTSSAAFMRAMAPSLEPPAYARIRVPALAVYPVMDSAAQLPWYTLLDSAGKAATRRTWDFFRARGERQRETFQREVAGGRVALIRGAGHYAHLTHQREVIALVRAFLSEANPSRGEDAAAQMSAAEVNPKQAYESKSVNAGGTRFQYLDFGGTGVPVLLIPGRHLPAAVMAELGTLLSSGNRVLALTPRAIGDSAIGGGKVSDHARDLLNFMDALKLDRAVLVSNIADEITYIAEHETARVAALVFLGGPPRAPEAVFASKTPQRAMEMFLRAVAPPGFNLESEDIEYRPN